MGKPYHGRRRRRPGRRLRYRGSGLPPPSPSYQDFGLRHLYDLFLPRGRYRRHFFNDVSGVLVLVFGGLGAALGWSVLGPLGLFLGFGAGAALGNQYLVKNRYFRA